jgi:hypothetical protein
MHQLKQAGIDAIELKSAWRQVSESQRHVSRIDPHPSALVHQKFAEVFVDTLQSRGWIAKLTRLSH